MIDTEHFLDLAIAADGRFLTLVTTNSGNGDGSDHSYWGAPFLPSPR